MPWQPVVPLIAAEQNGCWTKFQTRSKTTGISPMAGADESARGRS